MRHDEILGDLAEILGDDELMGAPMGLATRGQALGALPGRRVVQRGYSKGRKQTLPLSSTGTIAASTQAIISAQPQTLFRCERLVVQDPNNNFTIQDFKVGNKSQFSSSGTVPSALFANNSVGVGLISDTAQVSMLVSVTATNTDGAAAHQFIAAVIGTSVD